MSAGGSQIRITRSIATGDACDVLLAVQSDDAGGQHLVCVKRILPKNAVDPQFVECWLNEASAAQTLSHVNIAAVHQVVREAPGGHIVSEYVAGEDLGVLLRAQATDDLSVPPRIACGIIDQVAQALSYAHGASGSGDQPRPFVHGGLSAGNVIVGRDGIVKLTDFGMGRADTACAHGQSKTLRMKMAYRAPEQLQHKCVDARTDIYVVGVLFYELLTGRRLFRGDSEAAVVRSVMEQPVTPPSALNADIPEELEKLVLAAIARNPRARLASADELRAGLASVFAPIGGAAGPEEIAAWLANALGERQLRRERAERAAIAQASAAPGALPTGELPSLHGDMVFGDDEARPRTGSTGGYGSGISSQVQVGAQGNKLVWWLAALGGVGLALLLVLVAGLAFLAGGQGDSADRPLAVTAPGALQTVEGESSPAALVFHVFPEGSQLAVNGRVVASVVGTEGVLVPVEAESTVTVRASRAGYAATERKIVTPRSGTQHVYLDLESLAPGPSSP